MGTNYRSETLVARAFGPSFALGLLGTERLAAMARVGFRCGVALPLLLLPSPLRSRWAACSLSGLSHWASTSLPRLPPPAAAARIASHRIAQQQPGSSSLTPSCRLSVVQQLILPPVFAFQSLDPELPYPPRAFPSPCPRVRHAVPFCD
ncbi:hypothetical protein Mapa_011423 [Marchantia paleacea]|nr:hypothetical protein Mapa_011423 [Marchantia paleacea]